MSGEPTDDPGDYSYDLAHDVPPARPQVAATPAARPDQPEPVPEADSGDYSYDLAHEVPR